MSIQWNIIQPLIRNDVLIHATMQMNLRNIMPNEMSDTKGYIVYTILLL